MPTSGVSCGSSPTCRSKTSAGWRHCLARISTRRRSCSRRRRPRCSTAARPRWQPNRRRSETFMGGGAGEDLPTLSIGEGMNIAHALTALGFTPSNKRSEAEDRRRRGSGRRRRRERSGADAGPPRGASKAQPRQEAARAPRPLAAPDENHSGDDEQGAGDAPDVDRLARKPKGAELIEDQRHDDLAGNADGDQ